PPPATNNNQIATTAWVNSLIAGGLLQTNIAAPATPAAGTTWLYVDSTTKVLSFKNDAGTVGNAVVPSVAVANQFMTGISAAAAAVGSSVLPFANGGTNDTGTAPGAFTPSLTCGTATFTVNSAKSKKLANKVTFIELDFTITAIGTCTSPVLWTMPSATNGS